MPYQDTDTLRSTARALLVRLLAEPPDLSVLRADSWELIRENADSFGVATLVAFIARQHPGLQERHWCDQRITRSWARFNKTMQDLEDAGAALDDAGIPYIPLKGPFLASRLYAPPFMRRPSVDLDIAIRSKDLENACGAITQMGYVLSSSIREATASSHHVVFQHASKTRIELHFRLSHGVFGVKMDEFFERAVESTLPSGRRTWLLSPADELLHLALHLASDRFSSLFHSYELRRMWRSAPDNLREQVVLSAADHGFAGAMALTDIGFRLRWNEPFLPPNVKLPRTWLSWRINERLYESLENWMEPGWPLAARLKARWLDIQTTDRITDALRLLPVLARVANMRIKHREWGAVRPRQLPTGTK